MTTPIGGFDPQSVLLRAQDEVDSGSTKSANFRNEMEAVHNKISGLLGNVLQGVMGVLGKGGAKGGGKGGGGGGKG